MDRTSRVHAMEIYIQNIGLGFVSMSARYES